MHRQFWFLLRPPPHPTFTQFKNFKKWLFKYENNSSRFLDLVKTSCNQNFQTFWDKKITSKFLDCSGPLHPPASYETILLWGSFLTPVIRDTDKHTPRQTGILILCLLWHIWIYLFFYFLIIIYFHRLPVFFCVFYVQIFCVCLPIFCTKSLHLKIWLPKSLQIDNMCHSVFSHILSPGKADTQCHYI